MDVYMMVSVFVIMFLWSVWGKSTWLDQFIRFLLLVMWVSGLILSLISYGFIVKV